MNVLSLDLGSKTGWAHSSGASGVFDFSIRRDESGGMRLIRFEAKLREIMATLPVDVIVWETISAGRGPKANFDAIKFQTKLQAIVERLVETTTGIECCSYNIHAIKRHAIPGKGKRDKDAMVAAARKRWPDVDVVDDNHADALFLLDLAEKELSTEHGGLNDEIHDRGQDVCRSVAQGGAGGRIDDLADIKQRQARDG